MTLDGAAVRARIVRFVRSKPVLRATARPISRAWLSLRPQFEQWVRDRKPSVAAVTRHNTRAAYEQLYGSTELLREYLAPSRLLFYEEVASACCEQPFRSILDAGCGSGHLLKAVAHRVDNAVHFAGFDHASNAIERARELVPRAQWSVGSIYDPPFEGPFELVVCAEVLEHLHEPELALDALNRRRAEGGRLIITVPDGAQDDFSGHVNFWSVDELVRFLEPVGTVEIRRIDDDLTLLAIVS